MALKEFLKNLLGNSSTQADGFFQYSADSEGLNFYINQEKFDELKAGIGAPSALVQLIVLRMLFEAGRASEIANGFHMLSAAVAELDAEQVEILQLPPSYPGEFTSHIHGRTGSSAFRVNVFARLESGELPFNRKGPFLYLSSTELYRLNPGELQGLIAVEEHLVLSPEQRCESENIRLIATLKKAYQLGMNIDLAHFDNMHIHIPAHIGVAASHLPDGSLLLSPSLGDGSVPDELERRWDQLDMSAPGGALRINNRVVLIEPAKMAAIKEVLANKRIPPHQVANFIASPSAFLDAALVNLDLGFSLRVVGVGKLQFIEFGDVDSQKRDWFSLESKGAPPELLSSILKSPEDLARFEVLYEAARGQGAELIKFDGETIDISSDEIITQQIEAIKRLLLTDSQSLEEKPYEAPAPASAEEKERVVVLLRDADEVIASLTKAAATEDPITLPDWDTYARKPYAHQREGIEWMLSLLSKALRDDQNNIYRIQGGLLADDMGLGKTYMALVFSNEYFKAQQVRQKTKKPILVVAPLSLLENWEDEVSHTFKNIPFRDIVVLQSGRDLNRFRIKGAVKESSQPTVNMDSEGSINNEAIRFSLQTGPEFGPNRLDMDSRLVLTTYQTLRDYQFSLCRIDWGIVIFDEAQNIKNPNTLQTRAAKGLKADFKLLATGTPVENSLCDFWCLMHAAQPGIVGGWNYFREMWIKPILNAADDQRETIRKQIGADLRETVGQFMLRRIKEDQLPGLPAKFIYSGVAQPESTSQIYDSKLASCMSGQQLIAYDAVLDDFRRHRATEDMRGVALATLQKLREISLHPRLDQELQLIQDSGENLKSVIFESCKLKVLVVLLDGIKQKNEKVILFMVTKKNQRLLKFWLDKLYGLDVFIINGDTQAVSKRADVLTRKQFITQFEAKSGFNIIIMSPVAAGVGLTVVGANHVVHLERHWNPAKEAQASDRVYRIGQTRDVSIHLPVALHPQFDSFDIHLDNLLRGKLMIKDAVVTPEFVSEAEMIRSMGLQ